MPTATKTAQPSKKAPAKSAGTAKKAPATSKTAAPKVLTVKEIEAMSTDQRKEARMAERTAARNAKDAGLPTPPMPVTKWFESGGKKVEDKAPSKSSTPRGNFAVIPYPNGKNAYDLETQVVVCLGAPGPNGHKAGAKLPIRSFPTTTPEKRTSECRQCRDFRQNRAAKAEAKKVEDAKTTKKVESTTKKAPAKKTAAKTAKAPAKAKDAPQKAPSAPTAPSTPKGGVDAPKEPVAA